MPFWVEEVEDRCNFEWMRHISGGYEHWAGCERVRGHAGVHQAGQSWVTHGAPVKWRWGDR